MNAGFTHGLFLPRQNIRLIALFLTGAELTAFCPGIRKTLFVEVKLCR